MFRKKDARKEAQIWRESSKWAARENIWSRFYRISRLPGRCGDVLGIKEFLGQRGDIVIHAQDHGKRSLRVDFSAGSETLKDKSCSAQDRLETMRPSAIVENGERGTPQLDLNGFI
jgi:hypothetical protein